MQQWLDRVLPGHGPPRPASSDASFRRYFRVDKANRSWIVMDAPPAHEDCTAFIALSAWLVEQNLPAPAVHAQDLEQGFLLLDDLGDTTLLAALSRRDPDPLYRAAIDSLVRMQIAPPPAGLPDFDAARLQTEMDLFADWYLERHCGTPLRGDRRRRWQQACDRLIERALAQPQGFVHRDYHSRNLMVGDPPGILDFQDAVRGPLSYDLVSLLRDCYVRWPEDRVLHWVAYYRERAASAGLSLPPAAEFARDFDWMGLQRHLKAAGIFARLKHRDGKAAYLDDIPRTLGYVHAVSGQYPELAVLTELGRPWPG